MTLLQDLVAGAAGDTVPVATLLRRLKIVAARTDAAPLAAWVGHELEGYPKGADLPSYRGPFPVELLGHFVGPAGFEWTNLPIPPSTFAPDRRESPLFHLLLTEPVAEVEQMARSPKTLYGTWTADTVRAYNIGVARDEIKKIVPAGVALVGAKSAVQASLYVGVLDAVRTRVLDLALELEKVVPAAGQADAPAETSAAAQQVIVNHFHSLIGNVAIASEGATQAVTVQPPAPGDEAGLLRYLASSGVDVADLAELRDALEHDCQDAGGRHPATPGQRVRAWMARAGTDLGTNAAGGLISGAVLPAITAFFGG